MKKSYLLIAILFFTLVISVFYYQDYLRNENELEKQIEPNIENSNDQSDEDNALKKEKQKEIEERFLENDSVELKCLDIDQNDTVRSCKEAVNLILEKYPGELREVKLENIEVIENKEERDSRKEAERTAKEVLAWIAKIKLDDPLDTNSGLISYVEVALEDKGEEITLYKIYK